MEPEISAVICTHNRAALLEKAIESLARQSLDRNRYEIIVVDNASTDETRAVCQRESEVIENLSYIHEPVLGVARARNTGARAASGTYVAYLDDDATACTTWLESILRRFTTITPQPGAVGGKVDPIWTEPRPPWLPDSLVGLLGALDHSTDPVFLGPRQMLITANAAFPRQVILDCGGFPENLGRKGANLLSGEDTALELSLRDRGHKVFYDPAIAVRHHLHPERVTRRWFHRRCFWAGATQAMMLADYRTWRGRRPTSVIAKNFLHVLTPWNWLNLFLPAKGQVRFRRQCKTMRCAGFLYSLLFLARNRSTKAAEHA